MADMKFSSLIEIVETVRAFDHGSSLNEGALLTLADEDLCSIEWLCRLVPQSILDDLKAHFGDRPMWGDGAPTEGEVGSLFKCYGCGSPAKLHWCGSAMCL